MTVEEKRMEISILSAEVRPDCESAMNGNKAAGVRVRNTMLKIQKLAAEVRKAVLEFRK